MPFPAVRPVRSCSARANGLRSVVGPLARGEPAQPSADHPWPLTGRRDRGAAVRRSSGDSPSDADLHAVVIHHRLPRAGPTGSSPRSATRSPRCRRCMARSRCSSPFPRRVGCARHGAGCCSIPPWSSSGGVGRPGTGAATTSDTAEGSSQFARVLSSRESALLPRRPPRAEAVAASRSTRRVVLHRVALPCRPDRSTERSPRSVRCFVLGRRAGGAVNR